MTGALMLCEAEFAHLVERVRERAPVCQVEALYKPCAGKTAGSFIVKTTTHPIQVAYVNGSINMEKNNVLVGKQHMSVEEAVRVIRHILTLDALCDLWRRVRLA